MGKKINDIAEFPAVTPADTDRVLGIDVSSTTDDPNGAVVSFTVADLLAGVDVSVTVNAGYGLSGGGTGDNLTLGTDFSELSISSSPAAITHLTGLESGTKRFAIGGIPLSSFDDDLVYIGDVVSDITPQLGGSLDVNGNKIVSTANGDIDIEPNGTGNVLLGNLTFDADQTVGAGQDDYVLTYDNAAGTIGLEAAAGGGGGGLVPISKTTASADAAVDIELTGGYSKYVVLCEGITLSVGGTGRDLLLRVSDDGGTTFETTLYHWGSNYNATSGSSSKQATSDTDLTVIVDGDDVNGFSAWVTIIPANGTTQTQVHSSFFGAHTGSTGTVGFAGGIHAASTAVTDLRFLTEFSYNITGGFHLYGVADGA